MDLDKLRLAWKAESARTQVTFDIDQLSTEVQKSHQQFRSMIFWRDATEVGTALILIPIWFVMGNTLSLPWTWYLTVPALIWLVGFLFVDRRFHPRQPSDPGHPLLFYAKESLAQVEHQIWLLRNVFWWYLLPFTISILAFFLQVSWESSRSWLVFILGTIFWSLFLLVIYGFVYFINQRAVRNQLEPRRKNLVKLVDGIEDDSIDDDSEDIQDLVFSLAESDKNNPIPTSFSAWAENWDRQIPSWREALIIIIPAAIGSFLGLCSPIPNMGPVLFQSVVGAVIPFEIALVYLWLRRRKNAEVNQTTSEDSPTTTKRLPKTPALVILVLTIFLGIMAFVALYAFVDDAKNKLNATDQVHTESLEKNRN